MAAPASILNQVSRGNKQQTGQRVVISGVEKIGKTTLACGAPNALLIPCEMDSVALNRYNHTPVIRSWSEVEQLCDELRTAAMRGGIPRGGSLVWDSGTALERFIHTDVLREDPQYIKAYDANGVLKNNAKAVTMESALGGYGKAYSRANEKFESWLHRMDELAFNGGINIIVTCHVFAAKVVDPAHGEYDTWDLQLHSPKNQKTYGKREIITQWADCVGFLHEPMFVMKSEDNDKFSRGVSSNQGRVLAVDRTPGWVAGNRYGLTGSIPIPSNQGWNHFADAVYKASGIDLYNRAQ